MIDAHSLGLALLHSLWQGGLIALVVLAALNAVQRSSLRYATALVGLSLLPVVLIATTLKLTTKEIGSTFPLDSATAVALPLTQTVTVPQQAVSSLLPYLTYV